MLIAEYLKFCILWGMNMKKNLVIIMADQLRQDVLGRGLTPNIDSIGAEGVRFERAYCASPLCVPARGAFFTGTWPCRSGCMINPWEPADAKYGKVGKEIDNLYTLLEKDWYCIHSGKQHLYTEGKKLEERKHNEIHWLATQKTYKEYLEENKVPAPGGKRFRSITAELVGGKITRLKSYSNAETGCYEQDTVFYCDVYFTEKILEGLRCRDRNRPLFLSAMFSAPHPPFHIPEPWYSSVRENDFEVPESVGVCYKRQSPLLMYYLPGMVGAQYSRNQWKEVWRVYLGLVKLLDYCVGKILNEIKRQGIYEDTLIVFTSDHGEMLGSHGLFQKMCMYEEAVRVPMYMKFPLGWEPKKNVYRETVSHVDVFPTLCQYMGLEPAHQMDGKSWKRLLEGKNGENFDREVFLQFDGNGTLSNFQRCIVKGHYKWIASFFKDEVFYELYDLDRDKQETDNLMFNPEYDSLAMQLAELLEEHMKQNCDRISLPKVCPRRFRELYGPFSAEI